MNREELRRIIRGTIVTVPTPFDQDRQVDLARMTDLTRWWVEEGLGTETAPLKVTAAMGEGPALGDDEWPLVLRTTVNAAGSDANVICALKSKDTLHAIEDAKKAQDLGAIGLQIDPPLFHSPTQDDYVRYFSDISDAIDIGIMIYNTHWYGCASVSAETMLRLADAEHVAAIKWSVPDGLDYDDMRQFSHMFNVIDNSNQAVRCIKNGGRGYISATIAAYPQFDLQVWQLLESGRYDEAEEMLDRARQAIGPWRAKVQSRSGGIRPVKGAMDAMGRSAGPPRLPTLPLEEGEVEELRGILKGLGWPVPQEAEVAGVGIAG